MSFLSRLFQKSPDPREAYRPVWHAIVAKARDPFWYSEGGVADTREGRFDMITAVLALVISWMERDSDSERDTAYLVELFVEDMDGQLRQEGIGDPTVGKHIGNMVGALGGRINAFAGGKTDQSAMVQAVDRNINMADNGSISCVAEKLRAFSAELDALSIDEFLSGKFAGGVSQ